MFFTSECSSINKLLWEYTDGSLAQSDLEHVEAHLRGCEACRREAESYRQTVALMSQFRQEAVPVSRKGWRDLEARLDAASRTPRRSLIPTLVWSGGLVAAATLLLLFVTPGSRLMHPNSTVQVTPGPVAIEPTHSHSAAPHHGQPSEVATAGDPDTSPLATDRMDGGMETSSHGFPNPLIHRSRPPMGRFASNRHTALTVIGPRPHNLPPARDTASNLNVDGGTPQEVRRADYVLPPAASSDDDHVNVIDTVASSSSGTSSGSDGTEEQHPW